MKNINKDVQKRLEWLVDKLIATEEERDSALEKLDEAELENLSLRTRLHTIGLILDDETLLPDTDKDVFVPTEQIFGSSEDLF